MVPARRRGALKRWYRYDTIVIWTLQLKLPILYQRMVMIDVLIMVWLLTKINDSPGTCRPGCLLTNSTFLLKKNTHLEMKWIPEICRYFFADPCVTAQQHPARYWRAPFFNSNIGICSTWLNSSMSQNCNLQLYYWNAYLQNNERLRRDLQMIFGSF